MTKDEQLAFEAALLVRAAAIETELRLLLDGRTLAGEIARPERLMAAMRHGVLNGGKRLRPFLVMESAALFAADGEAALRVAAALECVHCYSLIHDDLPSMDDDDLRRGQPTVHKAFDEATAILAGDALLTLAFDVLADEATALPAERRAALLLALARAAGAGGMVGGQTLDLEAERNRPGEAGIIRLQAMKTGALIRFACEAGAIIAGAAPQDRDRLAEFGSAVGLAFQLADDLLDLTADVSQMGKATGKDAAAGKATLVALHGTNWARAQLHGLVKQAHELLEPYGEEAALLKAAASFVAARNS
ncbi:polyprenyl synthetase family protein [Mesorhizobium neociceri]|uniref:Probable farnesyl diphosphate synthase n=1 Tax=Mesorhizobium neociceri TaxID=1307853 RepID=A0A838B565_9HYPH|nr:farnesyl diphosphate synthase [Mesorhizobium neociceri]MBA1141172.1 polyprenyl synthetase family protein [Mesorhizobium neociceri]